MPDGSGNGLSGWRTRLLEALRVDRGPDESGSWRPEADDGRIEVLAFGLGGETYGIEIGRVAEILLPRPVTPLPRAPSFVKGIASLRGSVLPVLDLSSWLGVPSSHAGRVNRILVVREGDGAVGFWVERVKGVVRFQAIEVNGGEYAAAVDPRYIQGIGYEADGTLVALLDADALCAFGGDGP